VRPGLQRPAGKALLVSCVGDDSGKELPQKVAGPPFAARYYRRRVRKVRADFSKHQGRIMKKFEYDLYSTTWGHGAATDAIKGELNKRGSEGWELVATTRDESPDDNHEEEIVLFIFKREK
jgi:Domain of unknown function (DUF4177)